MKKRELVAPNGEVIECDFTEEEHERRTNELLRRCLGCKPMFDMETGQNYDKTKQISEMELRRRGY